MGNYCEGEGDSRDITVNKRRGRGAKGSEPTRKGDSTMSTFKEIKHNVKIIDFASDPVKKVYMKIKPYNKVKEIESKDLIKKPVGILENGSRYEGQWNVKSGKREGFGVQVWADGSMYEGMFYHDRVNGKGRLIHANGDYYEGEWKNDEAHGEGTYKSWTVKSSHDDVS